MQEPPSVRTSKTKHGKSLCKDQQVSCGLDNHLVPKQSRHGNTPPLKYENVKSNASPTNIFLCDTIHSDKELSYSAKRGDITKGNFLWCLLSLIKFQPAEFPNSTCNNYY